MFSHYRQILTSSTALSIRLPAPILAAAIQTASCVCPEELCPLPVKTTRKSRYKKRWVNVPEFADFGCISSLTEMIDKSFSFTDVTILPQVQKLSVGSIPRSLVVVLEDDLVDCCKSGKTVARWWDSVLLWRSCLSTQANEQQKQSYACKRRQSWLRNFYYLWQSPGERLAPMSLRQDIRPNWNWNRK